MKKIVIISVLLILYSCNDKIKDYHENGNLEKVYQLDNDGKLNGLFKSYDTNGTLNELHIYKKGALIDSSVFYNSEKEITKIIHHKNNFKIVKNYQVDNVLKSEGVLNNNGLTIGKWKYYNTNGELTRVKEHKIIKGKTYLNQDWFFGTNGDTLTGKGSYYSISFEKDTIGLDEPVKAILRLKQPLFKDKFSSIKVIIPKDYSEDFNSDFSNESDVISDTIFDLNVEKEQKLTLGLKGDYSRNAIFGRYYNTPGHKKFKGIIIEYYKNESSDKDAPKYFQNKKYFEKEIFVKDSIRNIPDAPATASIY